VGIVVAANHLSADEIGERFGVIHGKLLCGIDHQALFFDGRARAVLEWRRIGRRRERAGRVAKAFELGDGFRAGAVAFELFDDTIIQFFSRFQLVEVLCEGPVGVVAVDCSAHHADDFGNRCGGRRGSCGEGTQQGNADAQGHKSTICGRLRPAGI